MIFVFQNEGGLTVDDGGITNLGLVKNDLAEYFNKPVSEVTDQDIKSLTRTTAAPIYRALYWNKLSLDDVGDQGIGTCIMDTAVNRGLFIGAKYAQKICVMFGRHVAVDGELGPISVAAINQCGRAQFIQSYEAMEFAGYEAIIAGNPEKYARYRGGWEDRARRLLTLI